MRTTRLEGTTRGKDGKGEKAISEKQLIYENAVKALNTTPLKDCGEPGQRKNMYKAQGDEIVEAMTQTEEIADEKCKKCEHSEREHTLTEELKRLRQENSDAQDSIKRMQETAERMQETADCLNDQLKRTMKRTWETETELCKLCEDTKEMGHESSAGPSKKVETTRGYAEEAVRLKEERDEYRKEIAQG